MMILKYPESVVRPHGQVCREPSLFTLPPQGVATLSETDALALEVFCAAIRDRLWGTGHTDCPSASHWESYQRGSASGGPAGALHRCADHGDWQYAVAPAGRV